MVGAGAASRLKSAVVFSGVDAEQMSDHYHLCSPVSLSHQVGLELSLELSMSCQSLSYQPSSLSTYGSCSSSSRRSVINRSYHWLMRSEEMRQDRRRFDIVILFQACLSSALGHVAADSATCRTAASSARSARVAMTLRSNRETLSNLGTERLDPI